MRIFLVAALLGCAAGGRGHLGTIALKPGDAAAPPATFSVAPGHVVGRRLDVWLEGGCVRGTLGSGTLYLCREKREGKEHWVGPLGDLTVDAEGDAVHVDGYLTPDSGAQVPISWGLPLEQGPQWEELRRRPILLVAATLAAQGG